MADQYTRDQISLLRSLGALNDFQSTGDNGLYTPEGPESPYDQKVMQAADQIKVPNPETTTHGLLDFMGHPTIKQLLASKSPDDSPQYPNAANDYGKLTTEPLMVLPSKDTNEQKDIGQNNKADSSKGTQRKPALSSKLPSKSVEQEKTDDSSGKSQEVAAVNPETSDDKVSPLESVSGLLQAMDASNKMQATNQIAQAFDTARDKLLRQGDHPFAPIYQAGIDQAKAIPQQFAALAEQKHTQDENDPNSPESQAFRNFAQKLGYNAPPNMTAGLAKSLLPALYHSFDVQEAGKNRLAMNQQANEERLQQAKEHNDVLKEIANINANARRDVADTNYDARLDSAGNKQKDTDFKHLQDAANQLNHDKNYIAANQAIDDANALTAQIEEAKTNPVAANLLPVKLARSIINGSGRLNQIEIQKAGGSQALLARAQQFAKELQDGTITPENLTFMQQLANINLKSAQEAKRNAENRTVDQFVGRSGMDKDEAYKKITGRARDNSDDEDKKAVVWAKSHLNDPRAKRILKLHGLI